MASVLRMTASSAAKVLMRQNATQLTLTSARNLMTQAKVAVKNESMQDYDQSTENTETTPSLKALQVYTSKKGDSLQFNLENVKSNQQKDLIDSLGLFLNTKINLEEIDIVKYNFVTEEVYRYMLCMPFRKLGYDCAFTKYNHDKGLATFKVSDPNEQISYSFYKSELPNLC